MNQTEKQIAFTLEDIMSAYVQGFDAAADLLNEMKKENTVEKLVEEFKNQQKRKKNNG